MISRDKVDTSAALPNHKYVVIYTDGACHHNPGPGGWAAILRYQGAIKRLCGGEASTTNNRMEMMGAIEGLRALKGRCKVKLYTDSQYLQRGITEWLPRWIQQGWSRSKNKQTPVKNMDLWQVLHSLNQQHEVEWLWVKAHAGHPENEEADQLAGEACRRFY